MKFRLRKTLRVGPPKFCIKWNFTQRGYTGWSLRRWRWSYSSRTGRQTLNTPGLGHLEWGGQRRGGRR